MGNPNVNVLILGGGCSGVSVAISLIRQALSRNKKISISIYEKAPVVGLGIAYSTTSYAHLLNVPARGMSIISDEPTHFLDWLKLRTPTATSETFARRALYGEYLVETFTSHLTALSSLGGSCKVVEDEALTIDKIGTDSFNVSGRNSSVDTSRIVLATGNLRPSTIRLVDSDTRTDLFNDPWNFKDTERLKNSKRVLIIGTGLTAVDSILELSRVGYKGEIIAVSRHGFIPRGHLNSPLSDIPNIEVNGSLREVVKEVRSLIDKRSGADSWRYIVDALRPKTQSIWNGFSIDDKRRFLRHIRAYWDVHRHRIAPEIATRIQELVRKNLSVMAGRVSKVRRSSVETLLVDVKPRGENIASTIEVDAVINATGPSDRFLELAPRVIKAAVESGILKVDELGIGIESTPDGKTVSGANIPNPNLFVIGPLNKGPLWESIAVPEIRVQARSIAETILQGL